MKVRNIVLGKRSQVQKKKKHILCNSFCEVLEEAKLITVKELKQWLPWGRELTGGGKNFLR